jgi:hypothetical protein
VSYWDGFSQKRLGGVVGLAVFILFDWGLFYLGGVLQVWPSESKKDDGLCCRCLLPAGIGLNALLDLLCP